MESEAASPPHSLGRITQDRLEAATGRASFTYLAREPARSPGDERFPGRVRRRLAAKRIGGASRSPRDAIPRGESPG
jgi:hypothetical protein